MIDAAQERIEHHQNQDGDDPQGQREQKAGGGHENPRKIDFLDQAGGAGQALAALADGLRKEVVVQHADHQVQNVMRQVAAEDVGEHEIIEQDQGERVPQRPQKAQYCALVAHLEVFDDQVADEITVLPVAGETGGGVAGRNDGAGLHDRGLCVLLPGWSIAHLCCYMCRLMRVAGQRWPTHSAGWRSRSATLLTKCFF